MSKTDMDNKMAKSYVHSSLTSLSNTDFSVSTTGGGVLTKDLGGYVQMR